MRPWGLSLPQLTPLDVTLAAGRLKLACGRGCRCVGTRAIMSSPGRTEVELTMATVHRKFRAATFITGAVDFGTLFRRHADDGVESLEFDDFCHAVRREAKVDAPMMSDEELRSVFDAVEPDGSGNIEWRECPNRDEWQH